MRSIHRVLAVAVITACSTLLFACGSGGSDDDDSDFSGGDGGGSVRDVSAPHGTATTGDGEAPPAVAQQISRKIIFNAGVTLEATDVPATFNEAGRIATVYGGYVEKSSLSGSGHDTRSASVTIRVPADRYHEALADLRRISGADVREESARSAEVTEEYTDLESRLRNLERTEQQYLVLMEQAKTVDEILTMTDRLNDVRLQIEQVTGRISYLDNLVGLATIDVSIVEAAPASVTSDGPQGIGEALANAWDLSLESARYFAVVLAYLAVAVAWLVIPAAIVLFAARWWKRMHTPAAS